MEVFNIKVPGLYETIDDVLDTPIKSFGDSVITFRDIAKVKRTFEDRKSYANVNGKNSITIEVSKRVGENIIDTIKKIKEVSKQVSKDFPPSVNISFSQDQSKTIKTMLNSLQNNVIAAIILVLIIILGALGVRSGFLVGVSIPGSFFVRSINSFHNGIHNEHSCFICTNFICRITCRWSYCSGRIC